jgi:hypothetical protein
MNPFTDEDDEVLTLKDALNTYPKGSWKTSDGETWSTHELLRHQRYGNKEVPLFYLRQPVLWIGLSVYPAIALLESQADPLVTLADWGRPHYTLESHLDEMSDALWVDLDGVCWSAGQLRGVLTLDRRAMEVSGEYLTDADRGRLVDLFVGPGNQPVFLLVRDEVEARLGLSRLNEVQPGACAVIARKATTGDTVGWPRSLTSSVARLNG